jgi:hypothetical protein
MICPGSDLDCDNPGCRRGGCQGRPPQRLRATPATIQVIAIPAADPQPAVLPAGCLVPPTSRPAAKPASSELV